MSLSLEVRLAYAKLMSNCCTIGIPFGLDVLERLQQDRQVEPSGLSTQPTSSRVQLAELRSEILLAITRACEQTDATLREDALLFLFVSMYMLVFLPAQMTNHPELPAWRAGLTEDFVKILQKAAYYHKGDLPLSAGDVLQGTGACYQALNVTSGWLG